MASRIPQDFLDQLLSRIDIVDVINSRVPLRKAGREYMACCPFHAEKTPSFTVSPSKQFYHCFGCGAHGTAIGFLMAYEHLGFTEAVEDLARAVGMEMPRGLRVESNQHSHLLALTQQADRFFQQQLQEHAGRHKAIDYLRQRGLSDTIVETFGIGYAPPGWDNLLQSLTRQGATAQDLVSAGLAIQHDNGSHYDRFRDRITFPIRDRRGRSIAFGARTLGDATPKYLNSPETPVFHKGRELYGLYEARRRKLSCLLVVEGYMDVVALAQHDIPYAVATLGTATSPAQVERLFQATADLVFCFDGDRAGRQAAWRALENTLALLRDGRQARFLFLPEGDDPDSLVRKEGKQAFQTRLAEALPLSDYFFEQLSQAVDMHSIDGRARLAERARPLLDKLPDSVYRDMLIQRLAKITQLDYSNIQKRLHSAAAPARPQATANPTRTPIRRAIALLLHRPELAAQAGDMARFREIDVPGLALLTELVEFLRARPHVNLAVILEHYRDTELEPILARLAEWRPEIPDDLLAAEFAGALERLEQDYSLNRQLLNKVINGERLSREEKEQLRNMRSPALDPSSQARRQTPNA